MTKGACWIPDECFREYIIWFGNNIIVAEKKKRIYQLDVLVT